MCTYCTFKGTTCKNSIRTPVSHAASCLISWLLLDWELRRELVVLFIIGLSPLEVQTGYIEVSMLTLVDISAAKCHDCYIFVFYWSFLLIVKSLKTEILTYRTFKNPLFLISDILWFISFSCCGVICDQYKIFHPYEFRSHTFWSCPIAQAIGVCHCSWTPSTLLQGERETASASLLQLDMEDLCDTVKHRVQSTAARLCMYSFQWSINAAQQS